MNQYKIIDEIKGIAVVELNESVLGGNTAIEFTALLDKLVAENFKSLIVDFSAVQIMNSTGLGMLANAHATMNKNNLNLVLINIPAKIKKLFDITHLTNVFRIHPNLESALAEL